MVSSDSLSEGELRGRATGEPSDGERGPSTSGREEAGADAGSVEGANDGRTVEADGREDGDDEEVEYVLLDLGGAELEEYELDKYKTVKLMVSQLSSHPW
eukprot:1184882-Prorocentrum_minimum.AAC.2